VGGKIGARSEHTSRKKSPRARWLLTSARGGAPSGRKERAVLSSGLWTTAVSEFGKLQPLTRKFCVLTLSFVDPVVREDLAFCPPDAEFLGYRRTGPRPRDYPLEFHLGFLFLDVVRKCTATGRPEGCLLVALLALVGIRLL
jgi:hypothetical protein